MNSRHLLLVALALVLAPGAAFARRQTLPNGQVAHTRRAPVAAHRMVPPFAGVHVYQPDRSR